MAGTEQRTLQHFSTWTLTDAFHALGEGERRALRSSWVARLSASADATHHHQTYPLESRADLLVWLAADVEDAADPARFLRRIAGATQSFRRYLRPVDVLWGFTRPSPYSRARSRQQIDAFAPRTLPYLVMYPFTKTAAWYLEDDAARQAMMNEHIAIGKQYRDVTQLLVYSIGLQDQEFVVVYETPDLACFSRLVAELRCTRGRAYTLRDAPLHTAVHLSPVDPADPWP